MCIWMEAQHEKSYFLVRMQSGWSEVKERKKGKEAIERRSVKNKAGQDRK